MRRQEANISLGAITPFTCHLPSALHSTVKSRAALKRVPMVEFVVEGLRLALESEKYQITDDEKRAILG